MSLKNGIVVLPNNLSDDEREKLLQDANHRPTDKRNYRDQSLSPGFWEKGAPQVPEVVRLRRPTPKSIDELEAQIKETGDLLSHAIEKYDSEKGTNPNQARILELTAKISKLQLQLKPLQDELTELQNAKTPTQAVIDSVMEATQGTQNLARLAHETVLHKLSKERYDISDPYSLERTNLKTLVNGDKLRQLKEFTTPFFVRFNMAPNIGLVQEAAERVFDGLERLLKFLKD